ncbi:MAG TPA: CUAEP/CCAEP-tail radical SAM protein [Vicinamibacterales bacterium]|nr:CUAEP/CCAEP-tail radical SAM protein [Vicinamibacterales bacterium]
MTVLLLSTYDLGRQPFGLASPAAWLERAGHRVITRDLSRDKFADADAQSAQLIAFYLPMHTATRLAVGLIARVRAANPAATLVAYGLYAPLSESVLREHGVDQVLGPEAEADLVTLADSLALGARATATSHPRTDETVAIPRLAFITPSRAALPSLDRYATLQMPDGTRRITGATDATRGCKHRCRHCPIVPIYDGQFRVVPVDIVLADVAQQVAAGAQHITFGDPDFFNGPTHARRIIESLHARHPDVTYDVTIKIEHLLGHRDLLPVLAATGCLFVISAVEAVDDEILAKFEKRHTRADVLTAASLCRAAGVILCPTFVAFTPWTTLARYADLLDTVESLDLVEHVAPVQWGLRLLVTQGSRLLELDDIRRVVQPFDRGSLTYPWVHSDPRVDALQQAIMRLVGVKMTRPRAEVFDGVRQLMGHQKAATAPIRATATVPYLNEPWYC